MSLKQPAKLLLWSCSWFRVNFKSCDWLEKIQIRLVIGQNWGIAGPDWLAQMRAPSDWSNTNCAAFNCAAHSALISLAETVEVLKKQILLIKSSLYWMLPSCSVLSVQDFVGYFMAIWYLSFWSDIQICLIGGALHTVQTILKWWQSISANSQLLASTRNLHQYLVQNEQYWQVTITLALLN